MKRLNNKTNDCRVFVCPQCNKRRMTRPLDHVVNKEKQVYDAYGDKQVELYADICKNCITKNQRLHFEPSQAELKDIINKMHEDDTSIEHLL